MVRLKVWYGSIFPQHVIPGLENGNSLKNTRASVLLYRVYLFYLLFQRPGIGKVLSLVFHFRKNHGLVNS